MRMKTLLSWSTGKDSAWALHVLRQRPDVESSAWSPPSTPPSIASPCTACGARWSRRRRRRPACRCMCCRSPIPARTRTYERIMGAFVARQAAEGVAGHGVRRPVPGGHPPLSRDQARRHRHRAAVSRCGASTTGGLARDMIAGGLEAHVTCVDPRKLPAQLRRPALRSALLAELPAGVDPCAENGEFHTFACAGPMFRRPIAVDGRRARHPRRLRLLRPGSAAARPAQGCGSLMPGMRPKRLTRPSLQSIGPA